MEPHDLGAYEDGEDHSYHVHKQTLAVGPRSGAYWAKLFARWADGTAASELRLDGAAAACVPRR